MFRRRARRTYEQPGVLHRTARDSILVGAFASSPKRRRPHRAALRGTRDTILASRAPGTEHCTELSMGMTHDMALAIAEGATIVRVGTAIFGERAFI